EGVRLGNLADYRAILPDLESGKRILKRLARLEDPPEPVAAWRSAPEAALAALSDAQKFALVEALLPLVRKGRKLERRALRRTYQLFAFMHMPAAARLELIEKLFIRLRLTPGTLPYFDD